MAPKDTDRQLTQDWLQFGEPDHDAREGYILTVPLLIPIPQGFSCPHDIPISEWELSCKPEDMPFHEHCITSLKWLATHNNGISMHHKDTILIDHNDVKKMPTFRTANIVDDCFVEYWQIPETLPLHLEVIRRMENKYIAGLVQHLPNFAASSAHPPDPRNANIPNHQNNTADPPATQNEPPPTAREPTPPVPPAPSHAQQAQDPMQTPGPTQNQPPPNNQVPPGTSNATPGIHP
jgi:hypothetical protein